MPRAQGRRENGVQEQEATDHPGVGVKEIGGQGERAPNPAKNNGRFGQPGKRETRIDPGRRVGPAATAIAIGEPERIKADRPHHERERQG